MKEEISIIIENPPAEYTKELDKLSHFTKRHRNAHIIILNHHKKAQKPLLLAMQRLKNSRIEYYTPQKKMAKTKALKELIEKHIVTQYVATIPAKHARILRYIPLLQRKLRRTKAVIPTKSNNTIQFWKTKTLQSISKKISVHHKNYWKETIYGADFLIHFTELPI